MICVASAVPTRITAQPPSIGNVTLSSRKITPQTMANAGIRKVTAIVLAGPMRAISLKYKRVGDPGAQNAERNQRGPVERARHHRRQVEQRQRKQQHGRGDLASSGDRQWAEVREVALCEISGNPI